MTIPGRLVVVSGPGGVGKGTVVQALRARRPDLVVSVSATTRARRPGEVDGVHYRFLSEEEFEALVAAGGFLEWAQFAGRRYGTPWTSVEDALAAGRTVLLEIDTQGARQVRDRFPTATLVFLAPPSFDVLEARLRGRGTDEPGRIAERLRLAERELSQAEWFHHVVVNDDVGRAVDEILRILDATAGAAAVPGEADPL